VRVCLKGLSLAGVIVALAGAPVAASASESPHQTAKRLLAKCYHAVSIVPVRAVKLNTPDVARMNRKAVHASNVCKASKRLSDIADAHPKDKALTTAQGAYFLLAIGIRDYVQYLVAAAFLRADRTDLIRAVRETTSGKRLAAHALRELS